MSYTISLNGADNVGKTTQIELLPGHYTVSKVGGLHDSDQKIGDMHRRGLLRDWWWESSNEKFVCSIFNALGRRYRGSMAGEHSVITVFDRGTAMFEAVSVAVIAIKSSDRDLTKARTSLNKILEKNRLLVPRERLAIILRHGETLEESIQITISREDDNGDKRYRLYQLLLQSELERQERAGVYHHLGKVQATARIGHVQDKLREVILQYTQNQLFIPMIHNIGHIYTFSGLSESGKSSVAQAFCCHYGTAQAFRAKIVYFNDLISERLGKSVYSLPEKEQALYLLHELERFSNDHYWLRLITIESMHRYPVSRWLEEWMGKKEFDGLNLSRCDRMFVLQDIEQSRVVVVSSWEINISSRCKQSFDSFRMGPEGGLVKWRLPLGVTQIHRGTVGEEPLYCWDTASLCGDMKRCTSLQRVGFQSVYTHRWK